MTIIHMEPEQVRSVAKQLEATAEQIYFAMEQIARSVQSIPWQSPERDRYVAAVEQLRQKIQATAQQGLDLSWRVEREAQEWLTADNQGAIHFQELKRSLSDLNLIMAGGGGVMLASAQVLGASTAINEQYLWEYQDISWKKKFEAEKKLQEDLAATKKQLDGMKSAEELQNEINGIDAKIAELEKKKAEAQKKADDWFNKVVPDWPLEGDSDGVPWRVKADDFEDEVAEYDRQIRELQAQKQVLQNDLNMRQQLDAHLAELQGRQEALDQVVDKGVPLDGPSKWHPYFPGTDNTNCTKYAASKRDVPCRGDAHQWNEQAESGGFETGNHPVRGSVLVIEPDPAGKQSDPTMGHVAIVESVTDLGDGKYSVHISEGSWGGKYNERDVTIVTSGNSASIGGVPASFIYDKKK